jgi:hypothetical protein
VPAWQEIAKALSRILTIAEQIPPAPFCKGGEKEMTSIFVLMKNKEEIIV